MNKEQRKKLAACVEMIHAVHDTVEAIGGEETEKFDNLSEGLRASERGMKMDEDGTTLSDLANTLDDVISSLEEVVGE